ncbi:hypothetical protein NPIL_562781 [Nephila pilipes]|uniref:Uncharacterized protein n=1 Tax=Nephila pilipes TaxID=299642 RepID=A0A8X6UHL1_NEPPI|nr:hypothetical protein NPIL_562781 [Nephila pilipes]
MPKAGVNPGKDMFIGRYSTPKSHNKSYYHRKHNRTPLIKALSLDKKCQQKCTVPRGTKPTVSSQPTQRGPLAFVIGSTCADERGVEKSSFLGLSWPRDPRMHRRLFVTHSALRRLDWEEVP